MCMEIACDMTPNFFREYLHADGKLRRTLYTCNPRKLCAAEVLIRHHEARGDKVLVFCDCISILVDFAVKLKRSREIASGLVFCQGV